MTDTERKLIITELTFAAQRAEQFEREANNLQSSPLHTLDDTKDIAHRRGYVAATRELMEAVTRAIAITEEEMAAVEAELLAR